MSLPPCDLRETGPNPLIPPVADSLDPSGYTRGARQRAADGAVASGDSNAVDWSVSR